MSTLSELITTVKIQGILSQLATVNFRVLRGLLALSVATRTTLNITLLVLADQASIPSIVTELVSGAVSFLMLVYLPEFGMQAGTVAYEAMVSIFALTLIKAIENKDWGMVAWIVLDLGLAGWAKIAKNNESVLKSEPLPSTSKSTSSIPNNEIERFGDNDLVLGLQPELSTFNAKYGGKTYGKFETLKDGFGDYIIDFMNEADHIRFNLNGVNVSRMNNESGMLYALNREPIKGYTNYELWAIKNTPSFFNKTTFYLDGKIVPSDSVFK
jgi:hypothetical protein